MAEKPNFTHTSSRVGETREMKPEWLPQVTEKIDSDSHINSEWYGNTINLPDLQLNGQIQTVKSEGNLKFDSYERREAQFTKKVGIGITALASSFLGIAGYFALVDQPIVGFVAAATGAVGIFTGNEIVERAENHLLRIDEKASVRS